MGLPLKAVLPLFEALEAVQYTALRYTLRKPHGMNLKVALRRIRRAQRELQMLHDAIEKDYNALPR